MGRPVVVGVSNGRGISVAARLVSKSGSNRTYEVAVPLNEKLRLLISSRHKRFLDERGRPLVNPSENLNAASLDFELKPPSSTFAVTLQAAAESP